MKKLKYKFIKIIFLSTVTIFFLMSIIIFLSLTFRNIHQADAMTQLISQNNGKVPQFNEYELIKDDKEYQVDFYEETYFKTRFFIVYLDENNAPIIADIEHIASIDKDTSFEMAENVLNLNKVTGYTENYRYRIINDETNLKYIVFLDCTENFISLRTVLLLIFIVFIIFIILITLIFIICSKYVLKPFIENSQRQKQFITDASHELKTPLAIISANAEVLEYKNGTTDWTQNIINQTKCMSELINDLLTLAKLEELNTVLSIEKFNYTDIINEIVENFHEIINKKNITLEKDIQSKVFIRGDKKQLIQLISILIENATKYVEENGNIKISFKSSGKFTTFKIFNTATINDDFNGDRLFDRFYRSDSSRSSETGGHGIGLSIAKRITINHSGSIQVKKIDNGICFIVTISNNLK